MAETRTPSRAAMSTDGKQELKRSYGALADYLRKLEVENRKLAADLARKKREREDRESTRAKDGVVSRERLDAMSRHIDETDAVATRQREFLEEMQGFFAENEKRLASIGERIAGVTSADGSPTGATVSILKDDLVGILTELQEMRRRREQLMNHT